MPLGKVCLLLVIVYSAMGADSASQIAEELRQGQILQSQGRFAAAKQHFLAAVHEAEVSAPAEVQLTALSNLASVEIDLSRLDEAARLYEKSVRILQNDPSRNGDRMLTLRVQTAELYLEADQIETAGKLLRPIMADRDVHLRKPIASVAFALDVFACFESHKKKFSAAVEAERQSLSIFETLPGSSPSIALGTLHLATFLNSGNRAAEALPHALRALEMYKALRVQQPGMLASAEMSLASIYSRTGRGDDAKLHSEIGVELAQRYYGAQDPHTGLMLLARAAVLRAVGDKHLARQSQMLAEVILNGLRPMPLNNTVPVNALLPR